MARQQIDRNKENEKVVTTNRTKEKNKRLNPVYLLVGPDGKLSSKRTYGWAMFLVMVAYIFYMGENANFEFVMVFCGASLTALGISSYDSYKYFKTSAEVGIEKLKSEKKEEKNPWEEWEERRRRRHWRGGGFGGGHGGGYGGYGTGGMGGGMMYSQSAQPDSEAYDEFTDPNTSSPDYFVDGDKLRHSRNDGKPVL